MKRSAIHPRRARNAYAGGSNATPTLTPADSRPAYGECKRIRPGIAALAAAGLVIGLAACASGGVTVADTYCRDTFYWRTSARDTEETRRQADLHNSRRLCRCERDCN
jgi:hypothetical protein